MFGFLTLCQRVAQSRTQRGMLMAQDPWGERKEEDKQQPNSSSSHQSPPDLEEFFAKLLGRDKSELKRSTGGENHGDGNQPTLPSFSPKMLGMLIAVGLGMWLVSGTYTVQERENGVETVLGRYAETTSSGLNWNWPYPIGQVQKVDVTSIATVRVGEFATRAGSISTSSQRSGQMLTKDENIVEIGAAVQYRINNAKDYLFVASNPEEVLQDIIISAVREVVGSNNVDEALVDERHIWPERAKQIIEATVAEYGIGIDIVAFELQDARAPAEVHDAFEDAVRAREDEERLMLEAEAYARERIPIARGEAEQVLQYARAYQVETLAKANADTSRFLNLLSAYNVDKASMRERLYLETMKEVYANSQKVVVDAVNSRPIINVGATAGGSLQQMANLAAVSQDPVAMRQYSHALEQKEQGHSKAQTSAQSRVSAEVLGESRLRSRSR